jgi:hypothetical protein
MNAAARAGFMKLDENGKRIGTGEDGCEGYLYWIAVNEPKVMASLLARVLPYHIVPELPNKDILSYDEVVQLDDLVFEGDRRGAEYDLRGGLPRLFVRVPPQAQPARRAGRRPRVSSSPLCW